MEVMVRLPGPNTKAAVIIPGPRDFHHRTSGLDTKLGGELSFFNVEGIGQIDGLDKTQSEIS
ncbi:hypothetical protein ADIS_2158 [Lunatimonas lonarensis]|uniref:Uncharacterized protein n=1 Tax=Lunatimonas lonarensis TaxID=1232681 RepID=R7ZT31_9BACT|nr:hypothetical protein ADIS_2158 [Lunatimonas lonarensis]